jgi:hypothetical protein
VTPRWRVRLRYRDGRVVPASERLRTAVWLAAVLPDEADVAPVSVLPLGSGWTVSMSPLGADEPEALTAAVVAVEDVVGDASRVLGRLVDHRTLPLVD